MDWTVVLVAVVVGYLLGSISFARLVARLARIDGDITQYTVEIPGKDVSMDMTSVSATSVMMRSGPRHGCTTSLLDMAKVAAPALVFMWLYPGQDYHLITAVAGVAGHNYPIFHKFRGGRGMSPILGGLLVVDWLAIPVTILLSNVLGLVVFRNVMLAYVGFTILLIPWFWFRFGFGGEVVYAIAVTVLFFLAMIPDLKQVYQLWRAGKLADVNMDEVMGTTHLKYVQRFSRRLGLSKDEPAADSEA